MLNTVTDHARLNEAALLRRAQAGDREAFRVIMTDCNQRLFRLARAVLGHDDEAEDALQEAYLRAFSAIAGFRGELSLYTWLAAITLNEARGRLRRRRPMVDLTMIDEQPNLVLFPSSLTQANPEDEAVRTEVRHLLEHAVDELPRDFRLVFLLREVEGCSVEETAAQLDLLPATVKTRHHRARKLLRQALDKRLTSGLRDTFSFMGERCAALTEQVLEKLTTSDGAPS